ncbi:MAG TPA: molybdate ABC transporter permease subunit [Bryobacteraceae bacterium]|nr:molybdate ABC transporter permease subunit [Bryobacteraceae bacterium]
MPADLSPLWISLRTAAVATALAFVAGIAAARLMSAYHGRARGLLDGLLILPLVLPPTVVGFFLLLLFGRRSWLGHLLAQAGIAIAFSWPATVIAATVVAFPLMYRTTLGAFEQVNPNLLDAARTLGAGEWRTFRRVLLPLAWPGVMAGTVLAFARAMGEFGATLMLAGNIPGRTQTMPLAVFFAVEGDENGRALAWVAALVAMSLAGIAAMNYWKDAGWARRSAVGSGSTLESGSGIAAAPAAGIALTRRAQIPGARGHLEAEIHKTLPGFTLHVELRAGGGVLGVLGASGSGKSLTLRALCGLETLREGRIVLNGRVLFDSRKGIRVRAAERRVGMVFQDYALFPHLTVEQNIAFGLFHRPAEERVRRVGEWASLAGIAPLLARYPSELSGGQRQRVALARALAMEPEALLLDEPFSALDTHLRHQLEEQMRAILAGFGGVTVFVTHDRNEAYRLSGHLLALASGRVAASGTGPELFERPGSVEVARLTGCKNIAPLRVVGPGRIQVDQWNCRLRVAGPLIGMTHVGIRSHDVRFAEGQDGENTFPCWLAGSIDSPFETILYLRLGQTPAAGDPPYLEAELSRDAWEALRSQAQPWHLRLEPERLLLLEESRNFADTP